jgi:hypothetical protein
VWSKKPGGGSAAWHRFTADSSATIWSIACPTDHDCLAAGSPGATLTSANPTAGRSAWHAVENLDGVNQLLSVSCPSVLFCVAVDSSGNVIVLPNPENRTPSWRLFHIVDAKGFFSNLLGVSCAQINLCAAVNLNGDIFVSSNPAGGSAAWHRIYPSGDGFLTGISCVSGFCAAESANTIVTSANPTGGVGAWHVAEVINFLPNQVSFHSISCATPILSVAAGANNGGSGSGVVTSSTNPDGGSAGWFPALANSPALIGIDCRSLCVATGGTTVTTSNNPHAGSNAWHSFQLSRTGFLKVVSCAAICTAIDTHGNAVESTNPLGGKRHGS